MMKALLIVIVLALAAAGIYFTTGKDKAQAFDRKAKNQPVAVKTVAAKVQPMPVIIEAVGTVEPQHKVEVRAQINGVLKDVLFKEGDRVERGQLLFRIDERAPKAAVDQAKANLARDQAQLKEAQAQRERLEPLAQKEYITRQEYEQAAASANALAATAQANRAQVEAAQVNLSYSTIHAPIAGRTGSLSVKEGNLVSATATTPLVVINQIRPVEVAFNIPPQYLEEVRRQSGDMKVEISREQGNPIAEGKVVFIDNTVNTQTGTVLLKARIPNEKETLWPGEFVTARLTLRVEPNAIVVPAIAVQPGQQGSFVYIVDDGKAKRQTVTVARQVERLAVIAEGLKGGEHVIVEIPYELTPGKAVTVDTGQQKAGGESTPLNSPALDGRDGEGKAFRKSEPSKKIPSLDGTGQGGG
ncbi:MAG TPA: efflux RND transporter periplasmic adaptor subunit [Burkholderiales bacterium]|jgi:RND family efflux transporter MFP subunit|nr:efflux RND transporter periplasmic adaptor subunit [Burkholderiales bacterium]